MIQKYSYLIIFCSFYQLAFSQTFLDADGQTNTYDLINSVLAPGYDAVEEPDCGHLEFGAHIDQVFDAELDDYVFRFFIHKSPDNDRCINFDRQRNEIKTYDQSPDNLIGIENEIVEYSWKFKIDSLFQASSSFTHLHQIKTVGGPEASMPSFTLTARKGNPDKLEIRHSEVLTATLLHQVNLDLIKGKWVEAKETIVYGEIGVGKYEMLITEFSSGDTLLYYNNESIRTWKTDAEFQRPKWGIYRSLNDSTNLRDEAVLFADFKIEELEEGDPSVSIENNFSENINPLIYPNPTNDSLYFSDEVTEVYDRYSIYGINGELITNRKIKSNQILINQLNAGLYFIKFSNKKAESESYRFLKE